MAEGQMKGKQTLEGTGSCCSGLGAGAKEHSHLDPRPSLTCELSQVVKGAQGRRRWRLVILDELLCLLPEPGCFHLGFFQKLPWRDGEGGAAQPRLASAVLVPGPWSIPPSAWFPSAGPELHHHSFVAQVGQSQHWPTKRPRTRLE